MLHKLLGRLSFLFLISFSSCQNEIGIEEPADETLHTSAIVPVTSTVKMVSIPGGWYQPFFGQDSTLVKVEPFLLDEHPVTNEDFLRFVKVNPQWRKSAVKSIFTDSTYLRDWVNDTTLPVGSNPKAPVCFVSWFAAKAYSKSVSKRLPLLDEWEFVAMANETLANARKVPSYSDDIINLYLRNDRQFNSVAQSAPNYWGVYNMFDLIWEWTDDFNAVLSTGDSRQASFDNKGLFCAGVASSATDIMNYAAFMRFGLRTSLKGNYTIANLGFRCAKDIQP